ncbi:MAG: thiamine-phosphate kinase [Burkholderiaceae bacterium]|jgi:thiamine-monophosphate kinase|nr:thiamine-phosphate kinase [Burkholderiaceae bacterium]
MGEFDLIERFFKQQPSPSSVCSSFEATHSIALGIGDDCALLRPALGMALAVSSDMLVEGRHFFADVDPAALGHKALAVNLSDLAAMGAEPLAFTLALALPPERAGDSAWLTAFACGLHALAAAHGCPLVGGDTVAGPLNICITVLGQVPADQALRRDGAQAGDDLWVSGALGHARLALMALRGELTLPADQLAAARQRLERPVPRLALGRALRGIASSCIDLSDGLAGDLGHLLKASRVGARIDIERVNPISARSPDSTGENLLEPRGALALALSGGDDYELAFTAPPTARANVAAAAGASVTAVTRIGQITAASGLKLRDAEGREVNSPFTSFDHFFTTAKNSP